MGTDVEPEPPAGYLFLNGNAAFFDPNGEQLPAFQRHGWPGVHLFRAEYPEANVYLSSPEDYWHEVISDRVLEHIREPESE